MSDTFCPIPWIFQAIRNNGDLRVCCQANITKNKGVITNFDNKPFNAKNDALDEARNGLMMKSVRANMMQGIWSSECDRCKNEEANGLQSRRIYEQKIWPQDTLEKLKELTSVDGTIDTQKIPVKYYDLRFGNLCNLACRMCGPEDSHTWYEQWSKFTKSESFQDTHGTVYLTRNSSGRLVTSDYNWHNSAFFWEQIEKNISNIEHVYMAGGEPLLIERHYEFLEKCINLNVAKNITLEYNTNGTTLPNKVLNLWKHFRNVKIGISVDGTGKFLEYQRWPAKWSQIESNLYKLNNFMDTNPNITAWLAVTITAYNVYHIADLILWKISANLNNINRFSSIISPHIAHKPETTNIKILPYQYKRKIQLHFQNVSSKIQDTHLKNRTEKILNSIITYMFSQDWYDNFFVEFKEYTEFLDFERGQSIYDIIPDMKNYFKEIK